MKKLLLGDEAIALGAINAGLSGVYAYPGTPSTEITEFIQNNPLARERGVHSRWCTNEKTAMEAALGMSYAGKRALVCMKHVGMNVCADAFVNSAITGVKGGLVVLAADDPSMHSSQNEQDSRFYAKFALVPCFEPSNQQEAYDMMTSAFELSEKLQEPVVLRVVTRLAHSRAGVEVTEPVAEKPLSPSTDAWVLLPGNARRQYAALIAKQTEIETLSEHSGFNHLATVTLVTRTTHTFVLEAGVLGPCTTIAEEGVEIVLVFLACVLVETQRFEVGYTVATGSNTIEDHFLNGFALTVCESENGIFGTYLYADDVTTVVVGAHDYTRLLVISLRASGAARSEDDCYECGKEYT